MTETSIRNLLRNPSFEDGTNFPDGWEWAVVGGPPMWAFDDEGFGSGRCVRILQDVGRVHGEFRQSVPARGGIRYRLRARVRVALSGTGENSGANLSLRAFHGESEIGAMGLRPFFVGREGWRLWSADFVTPQGTDALVAALDMRNSDGVAWFDDIELFEAPEPLEAGVRSFDGRLDAARGPVLVRTARVLATGDCSYFANEVIRPLLGADNVVAQPLAPRLPDGAEDAIVIHDGEGQAAVSIDELMRAAETRVVIMSGRTLAVSLKSKGIGAAAVESALVAPCARIEAETFLTRGFRRGDVIPWWSDTADTGRRRQWFVDAGAGTLKRMGFETIATSLSGDSSGDGRPVILWNPVGQGGLAVMDLGMLDGRPRYTADANPALAVLTNAFGRPQTLMGTWVAPDFKYDRFLDDLLGLTARHETIHLREEGRTPEGRPIVSLTVGDPEKPVFFADAGIHPYEWAPTFGLPIYAARLAAEFEKSLPWARAILSRVCFKCVPVFAPDGWERNAGAVRGVNLNRNFPTYWDRHEGTDKGPAPLSEVETRTVANILERQNILAAVSWHETSANTNWIGMPGCGGPYAPFAIAIPEVFRRFLDGDAFYWQASVWTQVTDPRNFHYHHVDSYPYLRDYSTSKAPFLLHYSDSLGVTSFLVEQYGNSEIYHSASPQRTDMTCRIMETLLGLGIGLVCRNSSGVERHVSIPLDARGGRDRAVIYAGDGRVVERRALAERSGGVCAEGAVPPGGVLVVELEDAPILRGRRGRGGHEGV